MSLLTNFQLDANFWQTYPQMILPKAFNDLSKKDKSKGKEESSKIMWAVAMLIDNSETNKFKNLSCYNFFIFSKKVYSNFSLIWVKKTIFFLN